MKHCSQQFATLEGEPLGADDAAPACDHNCRQCPLRGTTSCISAAKSHQIGKAPDSGSFCAPGCCIGCF